MLKFSCCASHLSVLVGRKKCKDEETSSDARYKDGVRTLLVKLKEPAKPFSTKSLTSTSFSVSLPFTIQESSTCNVKVVGTNSPIGAVVEAANKCEDEHDENSPTKTEFSGFDPQEKLTAEERETYPRMSRKTNSYNSVAAEMNYQSEKCVEVDSIQGEHVTDPENEGQEFWTSPKLKRSCSNLESKGILKMVGNQFAPLKSHSFEDLQKLANRGREELVPEILGSPASVLTHCSADRVMLKRHSSSQVLPSRSRRLWWKLFLWSHRNMHKSLIVQTRHLSVNNALDQKGGYSSDTLEPNRVTDLELTPSYIGEPSSRINKKKNVTSDSFHNGDSGLWSQNHWLAFSNESNSFTRVGEWVNSLETQNSLLINEEEINDEHVVFPPSPVTGGSPARSITHKTGRPSLKIPEEVLHANSVIQSLNSASTVAHISVMGLKVIPSMSHFSNLRSINLAGNSIVHITPGSLPKGLHTLNLSRNKIVAIDGLRELSRLRILDLSYNRISRIGHGLSNCIVIKELHLAGNKISNVEGIHRLTKLTVLDLSFNKITTTKGLSQLVAHYNTLLALNLLGNPIQSNIGDDQLRKAVLELLPQLVYLNKQPIKPRRGIEAGKDRVARAALGNNERTSRKKDSKRLGLGGSSSSATHRNSVTNGQKHRHRSRSSNHQTSPMRRSSSALALSSHKESSILGNKDYV